MLFWETYDLLNVVAPELRELHLCFGREPRVLDVLEYLLTPQEGRREFNLSATVRWTISHHHQPGLTIGSLELTGGIIAITVGTDTTSLVVSGGLKIKASPVTFDFTSGSGCAPDRKYTMLTAPTSRISQQINSRATP